MTTILAPASTDVPTDMDRITALRRALQAIVSREQYEPARIGEYRLKAYVIAELALANDDALAEAQDAAQEAARPLCGVTAGPIDMSGPCASCGCWERR